MEKIDVKKEKNRYKKFATKKIWCKKIGVTKVDLIFGVIHFRKNIWDKKYLYCFICDKGWSGIFFRIFSNRWIFSNLPNQNRFSQNMKLAL